MFSTKLVSKLGEGRRRPFILVLALLASFLVLLALNGRDNVKDVLSKGGSWRKPKETSKLRLKSLCPSHLKSLGNSSLGFEKVFVVSLPERSDKQDAIRLTASLTGFDFEILDGIKGASLPPKALPGEFKESPGKNNVIGCWRAHMNFANTIIQRHLSTAVIFEDDTDWDVGLKSQLTNYALGSQYLSGHIKNKKSHSPYGDDWDMLYLGHCGNSPVEDDNRRFVIKNDPTVPPAQHRQNFATIPDMGSYDNHTRIIFPSDGGVCTYSYALSYRGAQKVLYHMSMSVYSDPVDIGYRNMCSKKERNFRCIAVFPQLVDSHRAAGSDIKDSDIAERKGAFRAKGYTPNIVHSTRLNALNLIDGEMSKIESQWPDEMPLQGPIQLSWSTTKG